MRDGKEDSDFQIVFKLVFDYEESCVGIFYFTPLIDNFVLWNYMVDKLLSINYEIDWLNKFVDAQLRIVTLES